MTLSAAAPRRRDPVADATAPERAEALALLTGARHAALAFADPKDGTPGISRIAFAFDPEAGMLTLVAGLAAHEPALRAEPACAVMLGEVGAKGDPMTHPRLMVKARAEFVPAEAAERPGLRARWLARNPKAKVYIDLPDFSFVRLHPVSGVLNGGFARAFRLTGEDLMP
ncbi:MAG: pyridoxamine 5'-phosphate oxidase family protein [Rhodobacteraceae bacterium]|jgi:putative heme iron utilization protein|nr:pyridoxamine 5'-phosphate oxidase family protein [Paracoccaceae bacterium]